MIGAAGGMNGTIFTVAATAGFTVKKKQQKR